MAYQSIYTAAPARKPLSKWWPKGVLIAAAIFFAIGGGLIGAYYNSVTNSCDSLDDYNYDYYCYSYGNIGLWDGGIACLCIGGVLKLTFWILVFVFCTQRRRVRAYDTTPAAYVDVSMGEYGAGPKVSTSYAPPQRQPQHSPAPTSDPLQPPHPELPSMEKQPTRKFCGQCGAAMTTAFCTQCGARI